jgi:hypothetical protein
MWLNRTTAGDNPDRPRSEAAFACLCGVAPQPASSGKTVRHRLSRGGDRQANRALHLLAVRRMGWDPATRAYVQRRTAEGLSTPEILRCLKRYLARQLYPLLVRLPPPRPATLARCGSRSEPAPFTLRGSGRHPAGRSADLLWNVKGRRSVGRGRAWADRSTARVWRSVRGRQGTLAALALRP